MVGQITPGELRGVENFKSFAEDIVKVWLAKYKFKDWTQTETKHTPVTEEMRIERAKEIAHELTNHSRWRSHGRSIKIKQLEDLKLKITKVDKDPKLSELVYRIHTVLRMLFTNSDIYKVFIDKDSQNLQESGSGWRRAGRS